ncbi:hypothetical protein D3C71_153680 [compost metagenome]
MAKEIERKFLVREEILIPILQDEKILRTKISQFYLVATPDVAVRLRKSPDSGEPVVLAVKHGGNLISTNEHEFPVPFESYDERLSDRVGHEIVKTRHYVWHGDREWEVDVFEGELDGLIVAELECDDAADVTDLPEWAGDEVTFDKRYKNAVLALKGLPGASEGAPAASGGLAGDSRATSFDEEVLDLMPGTDETAARKLRTDTLNPFSFEANGARQAEMKEGPVVSPERQKAFFEAMSRAARIGPDQIMRADPPFDVFEKPIDGLTEGLMFAPGDAVFTVAKDSDESSVEGNASVPEEGELIHVANSGHATMVSPHAAGLVDACSRLSDDLDAENNRPILPPSRLYGHMQHLLTKRREGPNIITIEDPPEYLMVGGAPREFGERLPHVDQTKEIGPLLDTDTAKGN